MCVISVILPSYNVGKYISKCLNSILEQQFQDFEILVVNDASTDQTKEICCEFAELDSRIKIIDQSHQGPAAARNTGIKYAKGKYVLFLDPDDWIEAPMLNDMIALAENHKADIVVCGVSVDYEDEKRTDFLRTDDAVFFSDTNNFGELFWRLMGENLSHFVWNRIIKTEMIRDNNIKFPIILPSEDLFFNIDTFKVAHTIVTTSSIYNHYVRRRVSVLSSYSSLTFDVPKLSVEKFKNLFLFFSLHGEQYDDFLMQLKFSHYLNVPLNIYRSGGIENKQERINLLKKYIYNDSDVDAIIGEYKSNIKFFKRSFLIHVFLFARNLSPGCMDNLYRFLWMIKNKLYFLYIKIRKYIV